MNRWRPRLVLLLLPLLGLPAGASESLQGSLTWNNGDALNGTLAGITNDVLLWHSPRFASPQRIHADFIESAEFGKATAQASSREAFRVQLSTGDILFGALTAISPDTITLESERAGTLPLRREFVREIRQLKHTQVIYDGPRWLDGWRVLKAGRKVSEWTATEHGHLSTTKYGGEIFHDLPQLDVAEIHIGIAWTGKPGFQIDFSAAADLVSSRPKPKLSIKSWGSDVVAQSSLNAADFQHLLKLTDRQSELRLRIIWDRQRGEILVTGDAGKELARVPIDKDPSGGAFGVLVKNRSDDLTLEQIRVSKWNGTTRSQDREPGKSYLRLANGELIIAGVTGLDEGQLTLDGDAQQVPLSDLAVAEFLPRGRVEPQPAHLRFQDGTEISGKIVELEHLQCILQTPISPAALPFQLSGIESLRFFQGKTSEYDFHLHFPDGKRLSGNLAPVEEDTARGLGWRSVGSQNAVRITDAEAMIERRMGEEVSGVPRRGTEVLYFHDGSLVTGSVEKMDAEQLRFQSPYSQPVSVPLADNVRAVEIVQAAGRVSFASDQWEFLREARPVQRSHERIEVAAPVSFRDLKLRHDGKLSFNCSWDEDFVGLVTIYLGTSTKLPRGGVARLTVSREHMTARCLLKPSAHHSLPPIPERRATVSLAAEGKHLSVWINGILAIDTELKTEIAAQGIWLQCGSAKGPLSRPGGQAHPSRLVIDRLRVGDSASRLGARFASSSQLNMLLNLPRNRRKNAPSTILCSMNGDLLRGHVLGVQGDSVSFHSQGQTVRLSRSDVAALVWLKAVREVSIDKPKPALASRNFSAEATLVDGSTYLLGELRLGEQMLIGMHPSLGECQIPLDRLLKLHLGGRDDTQIDATLLDWQLVATPDPNFDDAHAGTNSPFIGFDAENVEVPMLEGDPLKLGDLREKVVVLDFWATWSAPCIRNLPRTAAMMKSFPPGSVELIAINQEESPFTIKTFTASRDLDIAVGLDADLRIADLFGVDTIPHTVILGTHGRVERVFRGAPASLHEDLARAITELLPPTD